MVYKEFYTIQQCECLRYNTPIKGAILKKTIIPFDETYFKNMYNAVCTISADKINEQMSVPIKDYKNFSENRNSIYYDVDLSDFVRNIKVDETNLTALPLGVKEGLAGYLIEKFSK